MLLISQQSKRLRLCHRFLTLEITDIYIEETSTEEAGGQLVYQYEIGNNGPDQAANVQLQHFFTQGELIEYSVTSGECMVNQRQFDCDFGTLEAGETVIFDATVSGLSLSQHENNTVAKITTTTLDSNTNNNEIKQVNTGGSSCATEQVTANTAAEEYLYVLRDYRDNVLAHSAYGRTIIDTYYSLSPALVDAMLEKPIYTYYVKFFVGIMFFVALIGLSPEQFLLAVPFYFAGKFVYRRMSHSHLVFFKRLTAVSIFSLLFIASAFSQITYLHSNPMGSVIAATNEQGEQIWVKNYTPYGIEEEDGSVDDSGANHGYTTHEVDTETGLVYMKARYYDPLVGRFYSRDPIEADYNYFSYATNDPINSIDLNGNEAIRFELNLGLLGVNYTGGIFLTFPSPTGLSTDRFDFGIYHTSNPLSFPASFGYDLIDPGNPIANSSIGFGSAQLTLGLGWSESRDSMNGFSPTIYGGGGPLGLGFGGAASWNPELADGSLAGYMPTSMDINFGLQGTPWLPANAGYQIDYTMSYSMGDFFTDFAFPALDYATDGWFSGASNSGSSYSY